MAAVLPIFEEVDGEMTPRLHGTPDGVRFFTPEQAARRKGKDAGYWTRVWDNTLGAYAAFLDAEKQPLFVPCSPPADAPISPERAEATSAAAASDGEKPGRAAVLGYSIVELVALDALRRSEYAGLSDDEWTIFLEIHRKRRLYVFSRQLIPIRRYDPVKRCMVLDFVTSYHVVNMMAVRTGELAGEDPVQYCGEDREWVDVWTKPEPPFAARAAVWRKGCEKPFYGLATWAFYAPYTIGERGEKTLPDMWSRDQGAFMLAKCARVLAWRGAFPEDLAGLHTIDEMAQALAAGENARRKAESGDVQLNDDRPAPRSKADVDIEAAPAWLRDWEAVPETNQRFQLELIDLGVPAAKREFAKAIYHERHPRADYDSAKQFHQAILRDVWSSPSAYGVPLPELVS